MAPSKSFTRSDSSSTFNTFDSRTCIHDSSDSWTSCSVSPIQKRHCGINSRGDRMTTSRVHSSGQFPGREAFDRENSPAIPNSFRRSQSERETLERENSPGILDSVRRSQVEHEALERVNSQSIPNPYRRSQVEHEALEGDNSQSIPNSYRRPQAEHEALERVNSQSIRNPYRRSQADFAARNRDTLESDFQQDHEVGDYETTLQYGGPRTDMPAPAPPLFSTGRGMSSHNVHLGRRTPITGGGEAFGTELLPPQYERAPNSIAQRRASPGEQQGPSAMTRGEPYGPSAEASWRMVEDDPNKRRRLQRQYTKPYLSEMAIAHAERRSPVLHVPTTTTGEPIGLKGAWHRQVRLIARQCMDHSIRSYTGKKGEWWKAVDKIYAALEEVFIYDHPLSAKYLSKYLKGTVKNDRLEWKEYFITSLGKQHEKCPDEAFRTLRKYWVSVAGKAESEQMVALRALGSHKSSSHGSHGPASTSTPHSQSHAYLSTSSIPSGASAMGDSTLRASSSARGASTRGSVRDPAFEHEAEAPACPAVQITPEYIRRPPARFQVQEEPSPHHSGDTVRISQLETRVVDLSMQVSKNIAMVTEVLHTQRDFKDILLRLLNSSSNRDRSPSESPPELQPTIAPILEEPALHDDPGEDTPVAAGGVPVDTHPSWMSEETVLLTPNTCKNLRPSHPRLHDVQAVSTDISDHSVANGSANESGGIPEVHHIDHVSNLTIPNAGPPAVYATGDRPPPPLLQDPHQVTVDLPPTPSRGRGLPIEFDSPDDDISLDPAMRFPPRAGTDAIAVGKLCYLTHPDSGDSVIAEGKTGGSWRARAIKLGTLCGPGEQMVQIHQVFVTNMRLLHLEDRQPFLTLDEAVVKPTGSNVFVKWNTRYLHKKTT